MLRGASQEQNAAADAYSGANKRRFDRQQGKDKILTNLTVVTLTYFRFRISISIPMSDVVPRVAFAAYAVDTSLATVMAIPVSVTCTDSQVMTWHLHLRCLLITNRLIILQAVLLCFPDTTLSPPRPPLYPTHRPTTPTQP